MIYTYSPVDVSVLIGGLEITGFSNDTLLYIKKQDASFTTSKTADGTVARTKVSDPTYSLELTLAQTSPSNDLLFALLQADELSKLGFFPVFIRDSSGSTFFLAPSAWISGPPEVKLSNSMEMRSWRIECASAIWNVGGNDSAMALATASTVAQVFPALEGLGGFGG